MSTREEALEKRHQFILNSVETFGLNVDFDQWNEKGWIRIESKVWTDFRPLIIFQDFTEDAILDELRNYMYCLGEYSFKSKFKNLLGL
jgi:hypothetical protein